ncbi:MAG: ribosomal-protein-alanine N-acetyltransferase [Thermoleophilia bacterium]|mgnify:CR=1 FL=1
MREPLVIRRLRMDDLGAVEEIERRSMPAPWSRSMFAGEIVKPSSVCLGAFEGERLVGYVIVARQVEDWHVMNLVVAPERRRQGIATRLLDEVFARTADDRERGYTLEVRVSNLPAIRLYESMGFRAQGVRRGYYTDNREDALVMWRGKTSEETSE